MSKDTSRRTPNDFITIFCSVGGGGGALLIVLESASLMTMLAHHVFLVLLLRVIPLSASSWFWGDSSKEEDTSVLVSPIINRELQASVVAHAWPFTVDNVLCEAWAYHRSDWDFMDALVAKIEQQEEVVATSSQASQLAVEATSKSMDKSLLEYALSLRAYSPQCELHRGLARQTLIESQKQNVGLDAFIVAGNSVLFQINDIASLGTDRVGSGTPAGRSPAWNE